MGGKRAAKGRGGLGFRRPHAGPPSVREGTPQLSMRDEARNTERHSLGGSNFRLRHNAIGFVSAGNMQPEDPALLKGLDKLNLRDGSPKSEQRADDDSPVQDENKTTHGPHDPIVISDNEMETDIQQPGEVDQEPTEPMFFVDVEGSGDADKPELPNPKVSSTPPPVDDSSDDEVVFPGRGKSRPVVLRDDPIAEAPGPGTNTFERESLPKPSPIQPTDLPTPEVPGLEEHISPPHPAQLAAPVRRKGDSKTSKRRSKRRRFSPVSDEEDAILADYIENMLENDSSDEDEDLSFAEGVTSAEYSGLETDQIAKESENTWKNAKGKMEDMVISEQQKTTSGSNLADSNYVDLSEESSDEDTVSINQMGDIGDLLLDQDIASFMAGEMDDDIDTILEPSRRRNRKGSRRAQFPSASAFADALDQDPYGAFDIMDFDRPSLKKKPKGRRNAPDLTLSDSELEWDLHQSWESDRQKKKFKKQEREELRAQGLLGTKARKKGATTDVMSLEDITVEMRTFLLSDHKSLSLPPMDKKNRKLVHELASSVALKSISKGSGASRFPILTKTFNTPNFDPASIAKFDRAVSGNRFLRRLEKSQGQPRGSRAGPKARGGGTKEASYTDGEVVGASAPEIGTENKGRAMLEKMGWSMGTALGAVNNKGILQPVTHVVKTNKAGLG